MPAPPAKDARERLGRRCTDVVFREVTGHQWERFRRPLVISRYVSGTCRMSRNSGLEAPQAQPTHRQRWLLRSSAPFKITTGRSCGCCVCNSSLPLNSLIHLHRLLALQCRSGASVASAYLGRVFPTCSARFDVSCLSVLVSSKTKQNRCERLARNGEAGCEKVFVYGCGGSGLEDSRHANQHRQRSGPIESRWSILDIAAGMTMAMMGGRRWFVQGVWSGFVF